MNKIAISELSKSKAIISRLKDLDAVMNPSKAKSIVRTLFKPSLTKKSPKKFLDKTTKQLQFISKEAGFISRSKELITGSKAKILKNEYQNKTKIYDNLVKKSKNVDKELQDKNSVIYQAAAGVVNTSKDAIKEKVKVYATRTGLTGGTVGGLALLARGDGHDKSDHINKKYAAEVPYMMFTVKDPKTGKNKKLSQLTDDERKMISIIAKANMKKEAEEMTPKEKADQKYAIAKKYEEDGHPRKAKEYKNKASKAYKRAWEKQAEEEKSTPKIYKTLTDLGAGGIAGGISGLVVAPLATVADIAGTNAKSVGDSFYGMKPKEIAKMLYEKGSATAGKLGKNKILGGIKEFYGGQGLKTLKMLPQNAINLAVFSALTGAVSKSLFKDREKQAGYFENIVGVNSEEELKELATEDKSKYKKYNKFMQDKITYLKNNPRTETWINPRTKKPVIYQNKYPDFDDEANWKSEARKTLGEKNIPKSVRNELGYLRKYEQVMPHISDKENPFSGKKYNKNYYTKEELKKEYESSKSFLQPESRKVLESALNSNYNLFTSTEQY